MGLVSLALRRDPLDVLATLAREPGAFLFPVPDGPRSVTLVGCRPVAEVRVADGAADALAAAAAFVDDQPRLDPDLPFPLGAGVLGYLAYEAGRDVAPRARRHACPVPLGVLRRYDPLLVFEHVTRQWSLAASTDAAARAPWLSRLADAAQRWPDAPAATALHARWRPAEYREAIARIHAYLAAGDAYQVNLTQPFTASWDLPAAALFARLVRSHPVPYGAYLDCGDFQIVANSPELFLRRRGPRIETRPIKGTRARGGDAAGDAAQAHALRTSPKDRAEHVMIVDLERNDLGRVCVPGSVAVERLMALESHPTVHHLVSTVAGRLAAGVDLATLLRATFPGGSITGAPKIRAMEIVAELEDVARGVYTGALGLFDPGGDLELALPIRTAIVRQGRLTYHAGGGIVADSDADLELAECWTKTAALERVLGATADTREPRCSSG